MQEIQFSKKECGYDDQRAYVWWKARVNGDPIRLRMSYVGMEHLAPEKNFSGGADYLGLSKKLRKQLEKAAKKKIRDGQTMISHPGETDYIWLF